MRPNTRLVLKALRLFLLYDFWVSRLGFPQIHKWVLKCPIAPQSYEQGDLDHICQAVAVAGVWYPKETLCLQRSSVLVRMMRQKGIAARLVIGVRQLPFRSHAWVEVDGAVVNDRPHLCATFTRLQLC